MQITNIPLSDVQVVVLARGEGSRLRPFTLARPKALCPVCNTPILTLLLRQLALAGFNQVTVALPTVTDELWASVSEGFPSNMHVEPRFAAVPSKGSFDATIGCLNNASTHVLVIYGDSFLRANFRNLWETHVRTSAAATVLHHEPPDLRVPWKDGRTYHGVMSVDDDGRVTTFVEKPYITSIVDGFDRANAAVFLVRREILAHRRFQDATDFSFDFFQPAISEKLFPVFGCSIGDGFRVDLGSVDRLISANRNALDGTWRIPLPGREHCPGVWVDGDSALDNVAVVPPILVGRGTRIAPDCKLGPYTIVGENSTIGPGTTIRNSILMNDCVIGAGAQLTNAFLGSHCQVAEHSILDELCVVGDYSLLSTGGKHSD